MSRHLATELPGCTIDAVLSGADRLPCASCPMREFGVCKAVDDTTAGYLNRHLTRRTCAPHETILHEGDEADRVGVIRSGMAAVVKYSDAGRRQIVGFLEPGDVLGLSSHDKYFAGVEALTEVETCLFPRTVFEEALRQHPEVTPDVIRLVSNERVEAAEHELLLSQFSARERLAAFLMRRAERFGAEAEDIREIRVDTTRQDIGDYLGLSMENVSRGLDDMARRGIVSLPTPRIAVLIAASH